MTWTFTWTPARIWIAIGFAGQAIFTARFLVQWIASERKRSSVMPVAFWWLSLMGGLTLLAYVIYRRDPVLIVGQGMGLVVYTRNLMLVEKAKRRAARKRQKEEAEATLAALGAGPTLRTARRSPLEGAATPGQTSPSHLSAGESAR